MAGKNLDVVGIGNAIVDVISTEPHGFIADHHLVKGAMTLIDGDRARHLYEVMSPAIETSGGSAANTMAGVAAFGGAAGYIGKVRDDQFGEVFCHDMRALGVRFEVPAAVDGPPTARCLIIVTPDAARTMNTYLGASIELHPDDIDPTLVGAAKVLYCEGYIWDVEITKEAIRKAIRICSAQGGAISFTLSDSFCVQRHHAEWLELVDGPIDLLFGNEQEICALYDTGDDFAAAVAAVQGRCAVAALTRGAAGSVIVTPDEVIEVPPAPLAEVVDTTGAGDLYASGFLCGYTRGMELAQCGWLGSLAASEVISSFGARPSGSLAHLLQNFSRIPASIAAGTTVGTTAATEPIAWQAPSVEEWLAADPDPETRAELEGLIAANDQVGIQDRFGDRLRFGTAGIRGPMGAGPNRMNRVVVRQFANALVQQLTPSAKVVVAHDARHNSDVFANDVAEVLAAVGCRPILLTPNTPTPVLAFAVRYLKAEAGVMITASHNPVGDNGLKLYLKDGAQVIPPHDAAIEAQMATLGLLPRDLVWSAPNPGWPMHLHKQGDKGAMLEMQYLTDILADVPRLPGYMPVAYTPLQGVGGRFVSWALEMLENGKPFVVKDEVDPDPAFSNVVSPNPEDHSTLEKVIAEATRIDTWLAIANDPDADRMAAAVWAYENEWRVLSGDEIGALLCDWVLGLPTVRNHGAERVVASSIVSGRLVGRIAEARGATHVETLTGFKWISRATDRLPPRGADELPWRFVFGYEEALGFACNDRIRDKDGISAAVHFTMMCRSLRREGLTPIDRLAELNSEFGLHRTAQVTQELQGRSGVDAMAAIRSRLPQQVGGIEVTQITDFAPGALGLPPADVLRLDLADGSRVSLRPSGTEPLIKAYIEVVGPLEFPDPLGALTQVARDLL
ncbi:MAG: PfkB family carbohydrate kinase [bacterium]|nr:PfkB family carbohydrate kinase [bacterium]